MAIWRSLAALVILSGGAMAQTASHPEFEVASIKPAAPDARGMVLVRPIAGGITITNMTLKQLIGFAYRIQPFQISGGPPWFDSVHYDIVAKSEIKPKSDDIQLMLQALLADRFQLTLHRDTKQLPIYALVLAKKDGKLGPSLIESQEGSCTKFDPTKPPSPPEPGKPPGCGMMQMSPWSLRGASLPIAQMIPMLSRTLGRTVIDKTGLTGNYDMTMKWTPDEAQLAMLPPGAPPPPSDPSDPSAPSIFAALQEQLGLKLDSQKGPVEIFVIDHAEKPSAN